MENRRCNVEYCLEDVEYYCKCKYPYLSVCKSHKQQHILANPSHQLETIPESQKYILQEMVMFLNDTLCSSQRYFLSAGSGSMNFFKFEASEVVLPKDYEESFQEMSEILINEVFSIPRSKTEKIIKKCTDYTNSIFLIISNFAINNNKISKEIENIFNTMHSTLSTRLIDHINAYIKKLITDSIMKEKAGLIIKTSVYEKSELFFEHIMTFKVKLKNYCEEIETGFLKYFEEFLPKKDFLKKPMNILMKEIQGIINETSDEYRNNLRKYLRSIYKDQRYQRIALYKPAAVDKIIANLYPEWILVYNVLYIYEEVEIKQAIELDSSNTAVLLEFTSIKASDIILVNEFSANFIKRFPGEAILVSGSTPLNFIVLQNYPRKCHKILIDNSRVLDIVDPGLQFETHYEIVSAAVIDDKDIMIFTTNEGKLFNIPLKHDAYASHILLPLNPQEKVLNIKYKSSKKLLVITTTNLVILYNNELTELCRFQSIHQPFEAYDNSPDSIYFCSLFEQQLKHWMLPLNEYDKKLLNFKLRPTTEFFSTFSNTLSKTLKKMTIEVKVMKENIYSDFVKQIYYPINIQPAGERVSVNEEEQKSNLIQRPLATFAKEIVVNTTKREVEFESDTRPGKHSGSDTYYYEEEDLDYGRVQANDDSFVSQVPVDLPSLQNLAKSQAIPKPKPLFVPPQAPAVRLEQAKPEPPANKNQSPAYRTPKPAMPQPPPMNTQGANREVQQKVIADTNNNAPRAAIPMPRPPEPVPQKKIDPSKCELCSNLIDNSIYKSQRLCESGHKCPKLCQTEGSCCTTGKKTCEAALPAGVLTHEGRHVCGSEFHSCPVKCPMKECGVYCSKAQNHKKLHMCIMHINAANEKSCNEYCFSKNHKHYVPCKGGDRCGAIEMSTVYKHSKKTGADRISCAEFWSTNGWEIIN